MKSGTTSPRIGKASSELKEVIGKLSRGREVADELLAMFRQARTTGGGDMVEKILASFTHSLSILQAAASQESSDEVISQRSNMFNSNSPQQNLEHSGESCKTPLARDRRGTYKRRRTSDTYTKETSSPFEDGHAWRKYGQKTILNTKHPRNYFRCTHKYDQLCQATKQVQKIQDEPTLYRTTYHGTHTCTKLSQSSSSALLSHHLLVDSATDQDKSSIIWSFQAPVPQLDNDIKANPVPLMKQEHAVSSSSLQSSKDVCDQDYFVSPTNFDQFATFDASGHHLNAFSSGSDHADVISSSDVYSCTTSTMDGDSIDMASMLELTDFSPDQFQYN